MTRFCPACQTALPPRKKLCPECGVRHVFIYRLPVSVLRGIDSRSVMEGHALGQRSKIARCE